MEGVSPSIQFFFSSRGRTISMAAATPSTTTSLELEDRRRVFGFARLISVSSASPSKDHLLPDAELPIHLTWESRRVRNVSAMRSFLQGQPNWASLPTTLVTLNVSSNELNGPVNFRELPRTLVNLELANNRFSGSINLFDLPDGMKVVDLQGNQFSGQVALGWGMPSSLEALYLQNNLFTSLAVAEPPFGQESSAADKTLHSASPIAPSSAYSEVVITTGNVPPAASSSLASPQPALETSPFADDDHLPPPSLAEGPSGGGIHPPITPTQAATSSTSATMSQATTPTKVAGAAEGAAAVVESPGAAANAVVNIDVTHLPPRLRVLNLLNNPWRHAIHTVTAAGARKVAIWV